MRSTVASGLACTGVLAVFRPAISAEPRQPYSGMVVFGTSLSDPGNAFALQGATNTPPSYLIDPLLLVPAAPYARGGHHFSNGATWVEQLARLLGLAPSVRPAFRGSSPRATNYAVGGARARDASTGVNLSDQVDAFLFDAGGVARTDALYMIEMGGNDIRDALAAFAQGQNGAAIIPEAVLSIALNMQRLYDAGARHFLVWLVPDIGLTPAARVLGPVAAATASALSVAINAAIHDAMQSLSKLPGMAIELFDAYALIHSVQADPSRFGLTDTTTACVTPDQEPYFCQNPDAFLFWDGIHPTGAVHGIIADRIAMLPAAQPSLRGSPQR